MDPSQAARLLISLSAALGLSLAGWLGWLAALGLSQAALGSAVLGLWVGQLAFAPVHTHLRFQVWAPRRGFRCGRPARVSGVGPLSTNLRASIWASGEHRGCLSRVHRPGAEGEESQRAWLLQRVL